MLGNINLIGELYKKEMLPSVALKGCFEKLLPPGNDNPEEESIEMCCKLLTSVGPKLDGVEVKVKGKKNKKKKEKKKKTASLVTPELIESYYAELLRIKSLKGKLPARVNFQILDLIDLRKSKWKHRREQVVAKTKDEIKKDFEREERQRNADNRRANRNHNNNHQRSRSSMGGGDIRGNSSSNKSGSGDVRGGNNNRNNNRNNNNKNNNNRRGSGERNNNNNNRNNNRNNKNQKNERPPKLKLLQRSSSVASSVDSNSVDSSPISPPISPVGNKNNVSVKSISSKAWPQEKIDRDLNSSLNEYLAISNVDELILNLKELQEKSGAKNIGIAFTKRLFNLFLDKKDVDRQNFTQLVLTLLTDKAKESGAICTTKDFLDALSEFAVELPDLKFDAPKCDEWLSKLFGVLIAEGLVDGASIKKALKPVLDDPYSGQMVGTFAYFIMKTVADNSEGDISKFLDGKGLRMMYRLGISWAFKMYKMGAAERFLENSKQLLQKTAPALWLSMNFFHRKVILKEDPATLKAWTQTSLESDSFEAERRDDEQQDLSYGFTAAVVAGMPRQIGDLNEMVKYIDVLKSVISSDESASVNGCTEAIQRGSAVNNWKPNEEDTILDKLVETGVLPKTSVDFLKEWRS